MSFAFSAEENSPSQLAHGALQGVFLVLTVIKEMVIFLFLVMAVPSELGNKDFCAFQISNNVEKIEPIISYCTETRASSDSYCS